MLQGFGAQSTADDVLNGIDLAGKHVLITGVSSGLGLETARSLITHGASVVGTVRDQAKAEKNAESLRSAASAGKGSFEMLELDLASLSSVHRATESLLRIGKPFDVIVGNAGVMATPFGHTKDGLETQFGTNAIGHFALINDLTPLLKEGSRVVLVSSSGHRLADVDLEDPNFEHTPYDPWIAYGRSKTAVCLTAVSFDQRHQSRGIRACSLHPGGIKTELGRNLPPGALDQMVAKVNERRQAAGQPAHTWKSIPQGAATSVWAGFVAHPEEVGGRYCENCHVSAVLPDDSTGTDGEGVRSYALNPEHADAFWRKAEQIVNDSAL